MSAILWLCVMSLLAPSVGWSGEEHLLFNEDFGDAPREWGNTGGEWVVRSGLFHGREPSAGHNAMAIPADCPEIDNGTVEARVRMGERLAGGGWALSGIGLFHSPGDFWIIALNEDAKGGRYVDFIECRGGRWQAQAQGVTRLREVVQEGGRGTWRRGEAHILRLALDEKGITGVVLGAEGAVVARRRFEFGGADAVRSGRPALLVRGCAVEFDDVQVTSPYPYGVRRIDVPVIRGPSGAAAVLRENLPGVDPRIAEAVASSLREAGFGVSFLTADEACDRTVLHAANFDLLAVSCAASYPRAGFAALTSYARQGGDILLVGGPAFTRPAVRIEGAWVDRAGYDARLATLRAENVLLDGESGATGWVLGAKDPKCGAVLVRDNDRKACLKFEVPNLDGWAMFHSRPAPPAFPPGHDTICLRARGTTDGVPVTIELIEADGSRWMAAIELSSRWARHAIPVSEFTYWRDSPTEHRRGQSGDRCDPKAVVRVQIGLANAITQVAPGRHVFWLDDFGTTRNTIGHFDDPSAAPEPVIETASPSYKTYPLTDVHALRVSSEGGLAGCEAPPVPATGTMFAHIRRAGAAGLGTGRPWRVLPLVDALDAAGRRRGAVAWLTVHAAPPHRGCVVGCVGINDAGTLLAPEGRALLAAVARRVGDRLFLIEAGANRFTCRPGEALDVGAKVVNCGGKETVATVRIDLLESDRVFWSETTEVRAVPHSTDVAQFPWRARESGSATLTARVIISRDDRVLDTAAHELVCETPPAPAREDFIAVRDGEFSLRGKPWHPIGVNYWPLYAAATEPADFGGGWLQPKFYDPALIEEDLALMGQLGINLVSIQLGTPEAILCLRDFLRRCGARGIWVNGFLHAASPVAFDEAGVRALIDGAGLRDNPVLFAYDTIWEAGNHLFKWPARKNWDSEWRRWIVERYGSIENAERDWSCAAPREGGRPTAPSDKQMQSDGPWRIMVAAYRRFMDDITSRRWNDSTRRLRAIDPNHLISFRQGNTLFYDFALTGPVKHIDFISPEGYAIPHTEEGRDAAGFVTRYVKFTTGGKPVYWSEFGRSIWDRKRMAVDAAMIPVQADYHELFHRMTVETGAGGLAPWWWPGGYRVNEQSDYGIINPDGTPRPSAELFLKYGPLLRAGQAHGTPVQWMTVDRDAHPGGYWHVTFNAGRDACRTAREAGRLLGIRTEATGSNSANVPLIAVGNRPCDGSNPPKYLNAEFNQFLVRSAEGQWLEIGSEGGPEIAVKPGLPVLARVSVGNLGEALWLAPARHPGPGGVYLASRESDLPIKAPVPADVPRLADADFGEFTLCIAPKNPARIVLQMTALERAWFGEKREVRFVPR